MNRAILISLFFLMPADLLPSDPFADFSFVPCQGNCTSITKGSVHEFLIISSDIDFMLPDTSSQKMISKYIKSARSVVTLRTGVNSGLTAQVKEEYLSSSRYVNLSNPLILEMSKDVIAARNPVEEAEKIAASFISDKETGTPLLSSDTVLKLKAGDCKQHAVLLIAILRASHIPARAVGGLVFLPEYMQRKNVFVFHMWAEAFYEGRWMIADAAIPGNKKSSYIALAYHSLKSELPLEYAAAVTAVKDLVIRCDK
jgi:transglutaminase-like putative cysteine protease